jgi:hypothetical protein
MTQRLLGRAMCVSGVAYVKFLLMPGLCFALPSLPQRVILPVQGTDLLNWDPR